MANHMTVVEVFHLKPHVNFMVALDEKSDDHQSY